MALVQNKLEFFIREVVNSEFRTFRSTVKQLFDYLTSEIKNNQIFDKYEKETVKWKAWPNFDQGNFGLRNWTLPDSFDDSKSLSYNIYRKISLLDDNKVINFSHSLFRQKKLGDNYSKINNTFITYFKQALQDILDGSIDHELSSNQNTDNTLKLMKEKKLQVFVSSTYKDLIAERQTAVEATLSSGNIPAGMELFSAGDETQMTVIKRWIDESDVFLLLLGGRYGSIDSKTGKSYTHLEYEYAVQKSKPLFAVVTSPEALEEKVKKSGMSVLEQDNQKELKAFKEIVLGNLVKFWEDRKDITITIHKTLADFSYTKELVGWIRGDELLTSRRLSIENAKLVNENLELRNIISSYKNNDQEPTRQLVQIEKQKLRLSVQPNLWTNGAGYNGSTGEFNIDLNNKGETAFIESYVNNSEDVTIQNISLRYELEKGDNRKILGRQKGDKHIQYCDIDLDILYYDKLQNKYSSKIKGTGNILKIVDTKEL